AAIPRCRASCAPRPSPPAYLGGNPARGRGQLIKRRKFDMNALCLEVLRDPNAPDRRDAALALTPLQTGGRLGTQIGGSRIDGLPCEGVVGHEAYFGRFVQIVKDQLPKASQRMAWHDLSMPNKPASSDFNAELIAR